MRVLVWAARASILFGCAPPPATPSAQLESMLDLRDDERPGKREQPVTPGEGTLAAGSYIGPPGGKVQKFGILVSAVKAFTSAQDKNIRFGLTYYPGLEPKGPYPDSYGEKEWCIPGKVVFDPKSGAAAEVATFLDMTEPAGQTPTWETLKQFADYPPLKESRFKSHIVLITDGIPNCLDDMETGTKSIGIIDELNRVHGIPVFVVGFGVAGVKAVNTAILDKMAEAGGMPRPSPSPFKFYSASTPSEIADALNDIGGKVGGATVEGCVSGGTKDGGAGGGGGPGADGGGGSAGAGGAGGAGQGGNGGGSAGEGGSSGTSVGGGCMVDPRGRGAPPASIVLAALGLLASGGFSRRWRT